MTHTPHIKFKRSETGAALIVGLLLLLVLTILGISGMNSASLEFIMAGNEQFKNNAFQAAETGIEITGSDPASLIANDALPPVTTTGNAIAGSNDTYAATVTFQGKGNSLPGFGVGTAHAATTIKGYYFTIATTGSSARGATASHVQGVVKNGPDDATVTRDPNTTNTQWYP